MYIHDYIIAFVEAFLVLLITWVAVALLGKGSAAQLTPYDLSVLFIISNVGSVPINNLDVTVTFASIIFIAIMALGISRLSLHRPFYRLDFSPSILIKEGKISRDEMKRNNINIRMLLSLLRLAGYYKVRDVRLAILEPTGDLSVMPFRSLHDKKEDVEDPLSYSLIEDGRINGAHLQQINKTKEWLMEEIKREYGLEVEDVFYAEGDGITPVYINSYGELIRKPGHV